MEFFNSYILFNCYAKFKTCNNLFHLELRFACEESQSKIGQ